MLRLNFVEEILKKVIYIVILNDNVNNLFNVDNKASSIMTEP